MFVKQSPHSTVQALKSAPLTMAVNSASALDSESCYLELNYGDLGTCRAMLQVDALGTSISYCCLRAAASSSAPIFSSRFLQLLVLLSISPGPGPLG